jgi:hypothetical protein
VWICGQSSIGQLWTTGISLLISRKIEKVYPHFVWTSLRETKNPEQNCSGLLLIINEASSLLRNDPPVNLAVRAHRLGGQLLLIDLRPGRA